MGVTLLAVPDPAHASIILVYQSRLRLMGADFDIPVHFWNWGVELMLTSGMYSSLRSDWETPPEIFGPLNDEFHFELDVCATFETTKCTRHISPAANALVQKWDGVCWMNPPYGRQIKQWVCKAYEESQRGATVVCLLPARTDTARWHDYCMKGEIRFLRGRVYFHTNGARSTAAPFPSAVVIFRPEGLN